MTTQNIDTKKVQAAVKIMLSLRRVYKKRQALEADLSRLQGSMNTSEYSQYVDRIS